MLMQTHEARLATLREELKRRDLAGFLVPISDEHMSEYVGAYAQRLAWLTGFGGSAGTGVVLGDRAAMFVDGRYTIQVRDQVDAKLYSYHQVPHETIGGWLAENAATGARIGFDPWLHGRDWVAATRAALVAVGVELVAVASNPIDAVWSDRPAASLASVTIQPDAQAGEGSEAKRAAVGEWLTAQNCDAAVISALDSVAWLLNVRGADVAHTPVALSYVIAHADGTADWFVAEEKLTAEVRAHLGNAVRPCPRDGFESALAALHGKRVAVDPERAVQAIFAALGDAGATPVALTDPTVLPKARKNPAEQQGHRSAQARDGAAMARYLCWLEHEAPKGRLTELDAATKLQGFREATGALKDLSFDTISAAGPHAALPHYRVDEDSNLTIAPGSVFLCDSGGQYQDGTTDITRTVWIASADGSADPPAEVIDRNTRVLKGHVAIATAVFPQGTNGGQLDALARQYLWAVGRDYAHGTGHGVGSFLAVHEGPQRIAKPSGGQAGTGQELFAGMIISNEPGYYKSGEYGIRIENLVLVEPREHAGSDGDYLGFETLTHVPLDRRLIDVALLSPAEIAWVDAYHAKAHDILAPQVDGATRAWLDRNCAPLTA